MLDGLKRIFTGGDKPSDEWDGIASWAASRQYMFKAVAREGFVIDGRLGATPWRLEWGPSQRPYIEGQELRIRSELGLNSDLQLVVMNRLLHERMEKDVFEQYVEGVQTRLDNQTPPEMRWLVMFPKMADADMPELRERFIALSSVKGWLAQWLQGALTQSLAALRVDAERPVVLMIGRGRLMLRTSMVDADVMSLQAWLRLFEVAMREAQRVADSSGDLNAPSTQASQWSSSALPDDERPA